MSGKFDISGTLRLLTGKINEISGNDLELTVDVLEETVQAGEEIRGRIVIRTPEKSRMLNHLSVTLKGQIQRDETWQDYVRSAEVAHGTKLVEGHEFVVPVILRIPNRAVLTRDGAKWYIAARASIEHAIDPSGQATFTVIHSDT